MFPFGNHRARSIGRAWYAVTAVAALVAVGLETMLVATSDPRFGSVVARVANLMTYFTIDSNLIVAVVSVAYATGRARDASWFRAACVAALLAISITAAVFHVVLAPAIPPLSGVTALSNTLLHTVVPILFLAGWLLFGPRGVVHVGTVLRSLVFPLAWLVLTLIRGAVAGYYPYPFLDVAELGYGHVVANVGMIVALYVVLAVVLALFDAARAPHRR